jgi:hypothetical protein
MKVNVDGRIVGLRAWRNSSDTLTSRMISLLDTAGNVIASGTTSGETATNAWLQVTLETPVIVAADQQFVVIRPTDTIISYESTPNGTPNITTLEGRYGDALPMISPLTANPDYSYFVDIVFQPSTGTPWLIAMTGFSEAPTDGKQYGRQDVAWTEITGGDGGGISYSLNEQDTGLTWVDGKKIYQKTVQVPTLQVGTTAYPHGIPNVRYFTQIELLSSIPNAVFFQAPYLDPVTVLQSVGIYCDLNNMVIVNPSDRSAYTENYVNLKYTCNDR